MSVTGSYSNDTMLRQISEGVRIDKVQEWYMNGIISTFNTQSSHMTVQTLRDKFSHIGLHDARKHTNYFNVSSMNY